MEEDEASDRLDEQEAQRRFEKLVRTALNTPPKPMKDMPRKRLTPNSKRGETAKSSS